MTVPIGINGFGRIGRSFLRVATERGLDVVAINDLTSPATLAHLLSYDSTYGRFSSTVEAAESALIVDGKRIGVSAVRDPALLDWGSLGVDVVIESTGQFREHDDAALHLKAGARKCSCHRPASTPISQSSWASMVPSGSSRVS